MTEHLLTLGPFMQRKYKAAAKARFKRRILHTPSLITELSACKVRRLN